jgi:hypothetical protein
VASAQETERLASRYEILRLIPLGEAPALECRSGLALFLRRGMWQWYQSLTSAVVAINKSSPHSQSATVTSDQNRPIIQLLAAIAMDYKEGQHHERINENSLSPS